MSNIAFAAGMAAKLILAPEVEEDIRSAYDWYEQRRIGLGEDFLTAVDAAFERIRRSPDMHGMVADGYRRALLRRFPYSVFYEHVGTTVTVYGVLHCSRHPQRWRERLRDRHASRRNIVPVSNPEPRRHLVRSPGQFQVLQSRAAQ